MVAFIINPIGFSFCFNVGAAYISNGVPIHLQVSHISCTPAGLQRSTTTRRTQLRTHLMSSPGRRNKRKRKRRRLKRQARRARSRFDGSSHPEWPIVRTHLAALFTLILWYMFESIVGTVQLYIYIYKNGALGNSNKILLIIIWKAMCVREMALGEPFGMCPNCGS